MRYSNHRSKLKKSVGSGHNVGEFENNDGDIHLLNHFAQCHDDLSSLKWVIFQNIGKKTSDPAGNLLRWEHAFIEHFDCIFPNGLNKRE